MGGYDPVRGRGKVYVVGGTLQQPAEADCRTRTAACRMAEHGVVGTSEPSTRHSPATSELSGLDSVLAAVQVVDIG
jgi:hypothetical protein